MQLRRTQWVHTPDAHKRQALGQMPVGSMEALGIPMKIAPPPYLYRTVTRRKNLLTLVLLLAA